MTTGFPPGVPPAEPGPNDARTLYAILGHPVGQARSPAVFNALLARAGRAAEMVALDVAPEDFATALAGLRGLRNLGGLVVTVPHKLAAAELASARTARVALLGAANLLRPVPGGWEADLSDGQGFVTGLRRRGLALAGLPAAVVGAGGAGLAIAEALLAAGARVSITDRQAGRAERACHLLAGCGAVDAEPPGLQHRLVVNATPVGMGGDPGMAIDLDHIAAGALVAEVIMKPAMTPLLQAAAARGHPVQEGRHMLDGQVPAIWDFLGMGPEPPDLSAIP
jgi:shikimate dehydrogenase